MNYIKIAPVFLCLFTLSGCYYNDIKIDITSTDDYVTIDTEFVSYNGNFKDNELILSDSVPTTAEAEKSLAEITNAEVACQANPAIQERTIFKEPWRYEKSEKYIKTRIKFSRVGDFSREQWGQLATCIVLSTGWIAYFDLKELDSIALGSTKFSGLFVGLSENKEANGKQVLEAEILARAGIFGMAEVCSTEKSSDENTSDSKKICNSFSVYEETNFIPFAD
jgi:hypothetical protein